MPGQPGCLATVLPWGGALPLPLWDPLPLHPALLCPSLRYSGTVEGAARGGRECSNKPDKVGSSGWTRRCRALLVSPDWTRALIHNPSFVWALGRDCVLSSSGSPRNPDRW